MGSAKGWLKDAEAWFKMFRISSEKWVHEAIAALTGPAPAWCQNFRHENWSQMRENFSEQRRGQFTFEFADVTIAQELDSLMQVCSVKDYMESHINICHCEPSKFDVDFDIVRHNFMQSMKP